MLCVNLSALPCQSMSWSISPFMSDARIPTIPARSMIARSRFGLRRPAAASVPRMEESSDAVYAEGTAECLCPGMSGMHSAASPLQRPWPARKRRKLRTA